jgi:LmbE family N-acetylglucosaminyl deacetylase
MATGSPRLDDVAALGTILSLWAHPDDETYLAGGIMAIAAAQGQRVVCVSATAGERGTDDSVTWPPERLGRVRQWEASAAMAILGVTDHRFLGLPDGGLTALSPDGPVRDLAKIIVEVAPDTILTFGPDGGTFHPDHQAVSRWAGEAWDTAGRPGRILHATMTEDHLRTWGEEYERWGVWMTEERPVGTRPEDLAVHVELSGQLLDRKVAALCAMHTQVAPSVALLGLDRFRAVNEHESFVEGP